MLDNARRGGLPGILSSSDPLVSLVGQVRCTVFGLPFLILSISLLKSDRGMETLKQIDIDIDSPR